MDNYQLYQGDCLEIMKNIPDKSIDMILCDLPLTMTKEDKKDFVDSLEDEVYRDFANEIEQTLYKYGFGGRY